MVVNVAASDLMCSTTALYQSKLSQFLHWCRRWDLAPYKASIQQIADLFLCLRHNLKLSVLAVKNYGMARNYVFSLTGMDLASS